MPNRPVHIPENIDRVRPRSAPDASTIESLPHDVPHPTEYLRGSWPLDTWVCGRRASVRLLVSCPVPLPRDEAAKLIQAGDPMDAVKLSKQLVRDIHFEPGVPVKVPSVYRQGLRQTRGGVVVGGLLPDARLLEEAEALPIHPALIAPVGPTVPRVEQPSADGSPFVDAGMLEGADDDSPEKRALKRARDRRGA